MSETNALNELKKLGVKNNINAAIVTPNTTAKIIYNFNNEHGAIVTFTNETFNVTPFQTKNDQIKYDHTLLVPSPKAAMKHLIEIRNK